MIRRDFFRASALMGGAFGLRGFGDPGSGGPPSPPPQDVKRILILGGTGFIGPHMVRYARARGHKLTLFNRGRTNPHLFPDLEKLVGDRNGDLTALEGRTWDAVIDNSGYTPPAVGGHGPDPPGGRGAVRFHLHPGGLQRLLRPSTWTRTRPSAGICTG